MAEIDGIEDRCSRIAAALGARKGDEIGLLRTARVLKGLHGELRRVVWDHARCEGRTYQTACASYALDAMEKDLRRVLLEYSTLQHMELHDHLTSAVMESLKAIDLLARHPTPATA